MIKLKDLVFRRKRVLSEIDNVMEEAYEGVVGEIVNRVYPQIVKNLGRSRYVKTPKVELHKDIYARLSGIEDMKGEESHASKAEYDDVENKIFIYYPNMKDEKHVIQSLLHEYTHSLQDPEKWAEARKDGYENNPFEKEASRAEKHWKK